MTPDLSEPLLEDQVAQEPKSEVVDRPITLDEGIERAGQGAHQYRNYAVLACAWGGICGMGASCLPFVTSGVQDEWGLTEAEAAGPSVGMHLGSVIGLLFAGGLADKYGRRIAILVASVWTVAAHMLCAAGPSWFVLSLFFLVQGMGALPVQIIIKVWLAEAFVAESRGRWSVSIALSNMICSIIVIALTYAFDNSEWRMLLFVTALPGVVVLVLEFVYLDETSRYLYLSSGPERAMEQLKTIARENRVKFDTEALLVGTVERPEFSLDWTAKLHQMFLPKRRRLTITLGLLNFLLYYSSASLLWMNEYFIRDGHEDLSQPAYFTTYATRIVAILISMFLVDLKSVGRRWLIPPGFALASVGMFGLLYWGDAVLVGVCVQAFGEQFIWVTVSTLNPEVYPVHLRGFASGLLTALGSVGSVLGAIISGVLLAVDIKLPFIVAGITAAIGALLSLTLKVETAREPIDSEAVICSEATSIFDQRIAEAAMEQNECQQASEEGSHDSGQEGEGLNVAQHAGGAAVPLFDTGRHSTCPPG